MLLHIFARRFSLKRCVFPRLVSVEGKTWSPGRTYVVIRMMTVRNVLRMRARVRVRVCMCAGAREGEGERVGECVFVCFIVKNPDGLSKRRLGFRRIPTATTCCLCVWMVYLRVPFRDGLPQLPRPLEVMSFEHLRTVCARVCACACVRQHQERQRLRRSPTPATA